MIGGERTELGWRGSLVLGYSIVVMLLAATWTFTLMGPVSDALEERQREGLVSVVNATEVALDTSELPTTEVFDRIAASDRLRLTLIAENGDVLAESNDTGEMANHASRPEVIEALAGEQGFDRRVSETDGIEYLYVAIPSSARGEGAVLRVSVPVSQTQAAINRFWWTSFALLISAILMACGASWFSFSRTAIPMRRLEKVRTDFVANASHELKTPVAGIRLLTESIREASMDGDVEAVAELSQRLDRESARLQSLTTDLMDLSRLEDDTSPLLTGETCDLASVVTMSCQARQSRAKDAGLTLTLEDDDIRADGLRVPLSLTNATLLIDNLLDNAINYTDQGSVTVRLASQDDMAVLEVSDTGIGIPPADQDRVFERFYRVDTARSRASGGTGLGLSLVRHAVRRGGGTIELESELGVGSTFRVILPLA